MCAARGLDRLASRRHVVDQEAEMVKTHETPAELACTKSRGASAMSRSLTQECTSPWRFSSGIDSSFSSRSYTLWFSHAVSSIVIKVSISATLFIWRLSLNDDVALARHALPFLVIGAHVGREFRLSHVDHVSAHPAVALAYRPA